MTNEISTAESDPVLEIAQLERRQDDAICQLDELNARIENLIELYTRLRKAGDGEQEDAQPTAANGDASPLESISEAA